MSRAPRTERHMALAWAHQIDTAAARADACIGDLEFPPERISPNVKESSVSTPFPARPATARTQTPSDSTRVRWAAMERQSRAIDAALADGREDGIRIGYRLGWRWGVCCGLVAGALLGGAAWGWYLDTTAPQPPALLQPLVQPRT